MIVGVPRETFPGERRVALVPSVIPNLAKVGLEVVIEAGAGAEAGYPDAEYVAKGGKVLRDRAEVFRTADIITQVLCYGSNERTGKDDLPLFHRDQVLVGFLRPLGSVETITEIAGKGVTAFSVELMPRTTRAQSMDALSSMATMSGYKAVLIAADSLPKIFPMMTTAAGTITPARVLILGVGVAGLQAIATARRLGAVVSAYDVRPAVKEQVQNLGSTVPYNASQMYARNLTAFLLLMVKDGKLQIDTKDDIIRETLLTHGGEVVNPRLREFFKLPALATTGGA